jgi:hypothetical protein
MYSGIRFYLICHLYSVRPFVVCYSVYIYVGKVLVTSAVIPIKCALPGYAFPSVHAVRVVPQKK